MTLAIYLIITVAVLCFFGYAVFSVQTALFKVRDKQKADYKAYQAGLDNQLRSAGHSDEYVSKERQIRGLKTKRANAKAGYVMAWVGGIVCLFVFPPLGIFITGFAVIMSIREGRKLRKEMRDTAYEIKAVRDSMPEQ